MKKFVLFLLIILLLPNVLAVPISVEKEVITPIVIKELSLPATFNLTIGNKVLQTNYFEINTLLDITLIPTGFFGINGQSEKNVLLKVFPSERIKQKYSENYRFPYYVSSNNLGTKKGFLTIDIFPFKDAIDIIMPENISINDQNILITIENKGVIQFESELTIYSSLFDTKTDLSLIPFQKQEVSIILDSEKLVKMAGTYPVTFTFFVQDKKFEINKDIELEPAENIVETSEKKDLVIYKTLKIKKTNKGSVSTNVSIKVNQSTFSNTFTSSSIDPLDKDRVGKFVELRLEKELIPGESLVFETKTNYIYPVIILFMVAALIWIVSIPIRAKKQISIKKKLVRAKTKTGEFASKILVVVRNKGSDLQDVKIIDRLPAFTKLYERFGALKPDKIDGSKLMWNINNLEKNQELILSYIVYSRVKIMGRLNIPAAIVRYKSKTGPKEAVSNQVYLLGEEL